MSKGARAGLIVAIVAVTLVALAYLLAPQLPQPLKAALPSWLAGGGAGAGAPGPDGSGGPGGRGPGAGPGGGEFATPVAVVRAATGRARETLVLYGNVTAQREVTILPPVAGKVKSIGVRIGDRVAGDQVLAEIDRDQAGLKFATAQVTSTIGGVVKAVLTEVGASVAPSTPLFQIVDMDVVETVVSVPEQSIARVRAGQPVDISVVAYPQRTFRGAVSRVSPVVDQASRTLEVRVRVPNSTHALKPGMFAEARIVLREIPQAVLVPLSALLDREEGQVAFVVDGDKARKVVPEVAFVQDQQAVILDGIQAGQQVVVVGQQNLSGGDPVTVAEVREQ